ncbi:rho guanine nucleotide exchange factor 7-like [Hydractinia symbiolongicarpus]|uniref:rho guanine nucleotide exchange factor 7-like n=1 Tax=Hydractinia symbiolongicarpus TaxID=13093 RepID=UPI00254D16A7|nr:rho guanine nucleotide exchange factor 7-like [Hydractinia symbiolongicarpus]
MARAFADCLDNVEFLHATYQFVGSSDDELSFNKTDVIILTKKDDGGWWEGTLDGKIGWFPSNYVQAIQAEPVPTPEELPKDIGTEESGTYHSQVVENIIQTQQKHLEELKGFLEKYLLSVKKCDVLSEQDGNVLCGNYEDIVKFHVLLGKQLEAEAKKPIPEQRFGMCVLGLVNQMKKLYLDYCSNHPQAASLIGNHSAALSEYMENLGAPSPGIMTLTSFLSKPFLHVEKYGNQIKELEKHVQEDHIDNLDMKKATQVLQIIALSCNEVRKKKEMELEMLTGKIDKWEGEPISTLGSLVHMGQVFVEKEEVSRRERYFCLFPNDLVSLSVSAELVGYCFEERESINNISAKNIEDTDEFFNGFHLTVLDKLWRVMTSSPREKDSWMEALKEVLGDRCKLDLEIERKPSTSNLERSDSKRSEVKSLPMLDVAAGDSAFHRSYSAGASIGQNKSDAARSAGSSPVPSQDTHSKATTLSAVRGSVRQPVRKEWSFTRLRPTPPYQQNSQSKPGEDYSVSPRAMRRIVSTKNKMVGGRGSKDDLLESHQRKQSSPSLSSTTTNGGPQILGEDMMILSVIEAYCFSARQRQTMNCGSPDSPYLPPDVPPHFSFKPITPPRVNAGKPKKSKKFQKKPKDESPEMDSLKQQVQNLHKQTLYLRENLEEERKSRENFEKFLKRVLSRVAPDIDWTDDKLPQKSTPL